MKTLIFLRHGEAETNAPVNSDHERPLSAGGEEAARNVGRFLQRTGQIPGSAVSSSAVRARTTFELAALAGKWPTRARLTDALYNASPAEVLGEIHAASDDWNSLILVGHEPTWSAMVAQLSGGGNIRFRSGSLARVDMAAASWKDVCFRGGQLLWLMEPRLIAASP